MIHNKRNAAQSVHQQLLNKAKETKRPFNELLQYYVIEKFLLRMSQSPYTDEFVLKGALLLRAIGISEFRPTRDIDVLKYGKDSIPKVKNIIAECCSIEVKEDGLNFDPKSVISEEIRKQEEYDGIRITLQSTLGNARIHLQIDIGFGDVVTPEPLLIEYPTLIDVETPRLKAYTLESAIAEKYQAMVDKGVLNSRMKDYYDIYYLCENRSFKGEQLQSAIEKTFQRRKTAIPKEVPIALSPDFYENDTKVHQWEAFIHKISDYRTPQNLKIIVSRVYNFLWPVTKNISIQKPFLADWENKKWEKR